MQKSPVLSEIQQKNTAPIIHSRHCNKDGSPQFSNRLVHETSPYLLQHAHNPVNWFPWGEEAFEESKILDRPLFVSIGYSTCHWCHVMEEESFEDLEIAEYINNHFVAVKVDREERPDIDSIYMGAVQLIHGHGGWPLNVFLTPRKNPIFGGTYFPPRDGDRGAITGFLTILHRIHSVYSMQRKSVEQSSEELSAALRKMLAPSHDPGFPCPDILDSTVDLFKKLFDHDHGGVKGAPKFPSSLPVRFFMKRYMRKKDPSCLFMVTQTLEKMARGGMYDQIGGGFHRYSTDNVWLVPHFEKMLYDNALLAMAYLEAYLLTGRSLFRGITEDILDYVLREMRIDEGLFHAATDADSLNENECKEEGFFFTWNPEDIGQILSPEHARIACMHFSLTGKPHFEGRYIPHIVQDAKVTAASFNISEDSLDDIIRQIKNVLYKERLKRKPPHADTKIITAWNSLMISAFTRAGSVLENNVYTDAALVAATSLWEKIYVQNRVYRTYQAGNPRHRGCLDDHAFLVQALIDLYESTRDEAWLSKATEMDNILSSFFEDREHGGYFMTASDHESLIAREKPGNDHAVPSGNSIQALNLLRLFDITGNITFRERAERIFSAFSKQLDQHPQGFGDMLIALDHYYGYDQTNKG